MTEDQIKSYVTFVEKTLRENRNIEVELNRTQPNVIWDKGSPEVIPTWIKETLTIRSEFFYDPQAEAPRIPEPVHIET